MGSWQAQQGACARKRVFLCHCVCVCAYLLIHARMYVSMCKLVNTKVFVSVRVPIVVYRVLAGPAGFLWRWLMEGARLNVGLSNNCGHVDCMGHELSRFSHFPQLTWNLNRSLSKMKCTRSGDIFLESCWSCPSRGGLTVHTPVGPKLAKSPQWSLRVFEVSCRG